MSTASVTTVNKQNLLVPAIESAIMENNLMALSPEQRLLYAKGKCERLGINFLDSPFGYIVLNGKLCLYAKKECTDQLRALHKISVKVIKRELVDDVFVVNAIATSPDGREADDIGAVCIANLKGDAKANAMMKANTKAMRRVTLMLVGLGGIPDESEIHSIKGAKVVDENYQPEWVMSTEQRKILFDAMKTNGWVIKDLTAFIKSKKFKSGKINSLEEYEETFFAMSQRPDAENYEDVTFPEMMADAKRKNEAPECFASFV